MDGRPSNANLRVDGYADVIVPPSTVGRKPGLPEAGLPLSSCVALAPRRTRWLTPTLTYREPTGRPLAPRLPPPPLDGPDVTPGAKEFAARRAAADAGNRLMPDKKGRPVVVNNQALAHQLQAAHAPVPIKRVYGSVFEGVLGERVSNKPVDVVSPFPWVDRQGYRLNL